MEIDPIMTTVTIRDVREADAAGVAALVSQLGYETTAKAMQKRLEVILPSPDYVNLLADAAGHPVGLVGARLGHALEFDEPYGRLTGLIVDEHWRGHGLGRRLMGEIEHRLYDMGARVLILTSGSHRQEAHAFYSRVGYSETGLRFAKQLEPSDRPR